MTVHEILREFLAVRDRLDVLYTQMIKRLPETSARPPTNPLYRVLERVEFLTMIAAQEADVRHPGRAGALRDMLALLARDIREALPEPDKANGKVAES